MQNVDDLDLRLLSELKKDGNISVPVLSKNWKLTRLYFIVELRDY